MEASAYFRWRNGGNVWAGCDSIVSAFVLPAVRCAVVRRTETLRDLGVARWGNAGTADLDGDARILEHRLMAVAWSIG